MRFAVLGYLDEGWWDGLSDDERNAFMDECFAYDDVLQEKGCVDGGAALDSPQAAATVRQRGGQVSVTDGPFAETKEVLGGLFFLEAPDMREAVELVSKHPGARGGCFEIRPVVDLEEMVQASAERRRAAEADPEAPPA